jgi:hypothetical protein
MLKFSVKFLLLFPPTHCQTFEWYQSSEVSNFHEKFTRVKLELMEKSQQQQRQA